MRDIREEGGWWKKSQNWSLSTSKGMAPDFPPSYARYSEGWDVHTDLEAFYPWIVSQTYALQGGRKQSPAVSFKALLEADCRMACPGPERAPANVPWVSPPATSDASLQHGRWSSRTFIIPKVKESFQELSRTMWPTNQANWCEVKECLLLRWKLGASIYKL